MNPIDYRIAPRRIRVVSSLASVAVLLALLSVRPVSGLQATSIERMVEGRVVDDSGNPLAGWTVELRASDGTVDQTRTSNDAGWFHFDPVVTGYENWYVGASNADGLLQGVEKVTVVDGPERVWELRSGKTLESRIEVRQEGHPVAGAIVLGQSRLFGNAVRALTDSEGRATLRTPESLPFTSVWAFVPNQGVAYWYPPTEPIDVEQARGDHPTELTLDLLPVRTCTVTVIDGHGAVIGGLAVWPYFRIEEDSNRKFFPHFRESRVVTDENGRASFGWIPAEPVNWFIPEPVETKYTLEQVGEQNLRSPEQTIKVALRPETIAVRGHIEGPDDVFLPELNIVGVAYDTEAETGPYSSIRVRSTKHGEFEAQVRPDLTYRIAVIDRQWASDPIETILAYSSLEQQDDWTLQVYPATPVSVSLLAGPEKTPVTTGDVIFVSPKTISTGIGLHASIDLRASVPLDSTGRAESGLGRGTWTIIARHAKWSEERTLEITGDDTVDVVFNPQWIGRHEIRGQLGIDDSEGNDSYSLADATITLIDHRDRSDRFDGTADESGAWSITADTKEDFAVVALTADRRFGALRFVQAPNELPVKLDLSATARMAGRLVDPAGNPLAGRELVLRHRKTLEDYIDYVSVTTDANGDFEIKGIVPAVEHRVYVRTSRPPWIKFLQAKTTFEPGESRERLRLVWDGNETERNPADW